MKPPEEGTAEIRIVDDDGERAAKPEEIEGPVREMLTAELRKKFNL